MFRQYVSHFLKSMVTQHKGLPPRAVPLEHRTRIGQKNQSADVVIASSPDAGQAEKQSAELPETMFDSRECFRISSAFGRPSAHEATQTMRQGKQGKQGKQHSDSTWTGDLSSLSPLAGTERKQQSLTEGGGGGIAGSPFRIPLSHFAILSLAVAAESRMPGLIPDTSSHHEVGHEENFFSVLIDGPEWVLQVKRAHKLEGCRKNLYGP
ncbi:hypothetical protein BJ166DRAFT_502586 [Pestalotiopsis sp. NC0098]|nr:hypothetical protein BJ166DRAFT_502586 [Pestalotiopsis sp. NC0098]